VDTAVLRSRDKTAVAVSETQTAHHCFGRNRLAVLDSVRHVDTAALRSDGRLVRFAAGVERRAA
jgi:hypothetical protein